MPGKRTSLPSHTHPTYCTGRNTRGPSHREPARPDKTTTPTRSTGANISVLEADDDTPAAQDISGPTLAQCHTHLHTTGIPFLCRPPQAGDPDKGFRSGPTGNRRGLQTGARARWEATTQDIWYLQDGRPGALRRLGPGQMVHCRACDYDANGRPDMRGDCSAHTSVNGESLGVWCWGCQTQYWLDRGLPRIVGTTDPPLTPLAPGQYPGNLDPPVPLFANKFTAIDVPTGAGKTQMFKAQLNHLDFMNGGIDSPTRAAVCVVVFRRSLSTYYEGQLCKNHEFGVYTDIDIETCTPETHGRIISCVPSMAKLPHALPDGRGISVNGRQHMLVLEEVGQTRSMTICNLLTAQEMLKVDNAFGALIRLAPNVIMTEYRMLEESVPPENNAQEPLVGLALGLYILCGVFTWGSGPLTLS